MKHVLMLFAVTAFLFSCSSSSPESVARGFAMNMANGDIDGAKKYVTKEVASLLNLAKGFAEKESESMPKYPDYSFEMIKEEIDGDKAKVTYKNPEGKEETMDLIKIGGKWRVHMEK